MSNFPKGPLAGELEERWETRRIVPCLEGCGIVLRPNTITYEICVTFKLTHYYSGGIMLKCRATGARTAEYRGSLLSPHVKDASKNKFYFSVVGHD